MSGPRRRHGDSASRLTVSKVELIIVGVRLVASVAAGVVAYQIVSLYGDERHTSEIAWSQWARSGCGSS